MGSIRIVWGTGAGPTPMAAYDTALAAANVHNFNLVAVSSVIPATANIEVVGKAPDLGPVGERLTVVEGRATVAPCESKPAVACLGWDREPDGPGIFYEASGTDPKAVPERVERGLEAGRKLREWAFGETGQKLIVADSVSERYVTAVVLAVYGKSDPIV